MATKISTYTLLTPSPDNRLYDTGLKLREAYSEFSVQGSFQEAFFAAAVCGLVYYIPTEKVYTMALETLERPVRLKFYITVKNFLDPTSPAFYPLSWAEKKPITRLPINEVVNHLIMQEAGDLVTHKIDYTSWSLSGWLSWQIKLFEQIDIEDAIE
jgi:hypothetical protein